jgi:hypothetical protein
MRFAIAVLMTLFLVGTIVAQDATQPAASDAAQPPAQAAPQTPTQDMTQAPAQASDQTPAQAPEQGAASAPDQAVAPAEAPAQAPAEAQAAEQAKPAFAFSAGADIGSDVFYSGPPDVNGNPTPQTWTRLGFQPDFSFGKIGIGLDLTIHFMLYPADSNAAVQIYDGDWEPQGKQNILDVYLPKIMYVRYGTKGSDPFFAKAGSIGDLSLGDGFIMSDYSNMLFLPQQRIFGLDVGVDGSLFDFPYVGLEVLTGNLARLDVDGGRVFARPLVGTTVPILKNMQVGFTAVADFSPGLYDQTSSPAATVKAYGGDIMVPILDGKEFPLDAFTDIAVDPNNTTGWMIGGEGRLIGIFTYEAQLRILQDGFIPSYFDANYDIFRAQKFDEMQAPPPSGIYTGWLASLGTSLFTNIFLFNIELDGPFSPAGVTADLAALDAMNQNQYAHLRGVMKLNQVGTFPFYFDAFYDKYYIGAEHGFFQDLVDPTFAVIGLDVNYKTGAAVLTLAYNAQWNPTTQSFDVTSSLQASVQF